MRYASIQIKNFRGIEDTTLRLDSKPSSNIHCLVGLNESGKTTILEAINYFRYNPDNLNALELKGYSIEDPNSLIPIAKRSNFSGPVSIIVTLAFDASDEEYIRQSVKSELGIDLAQPIKKLVIEQRLLFESSKYQKQNAFWTFPLKRKKKGKPSGVTISHITNREEWLAIVKIIERRIPGILYFPNFLFDFPDKIYLDDVETDAEKHSFYKRVFQDILDELKIDVTVESHVVARAKSSDSSDRVSLEQLLLDASRAISKNVFSQWNQIFKSKSTDRKISLKHGIDDSGKCFVEFKIEEGGAIYNITERSLGFRWFFVFFLLTFYRAGRTGNASPVMFLFDEPASNLHQSAQAQLLKTFEKIGSISQIVYTTHSHHLIDPLRLDSTHIVRNEGLHDPGYDDHFDSSKTKIAIHAYRQFLSMHPDQPAYFQLILDVLDYRPSDLELVDSVVMTEGKGDFYWLKYVSEVLSAGAPGFKVLPGLGSGSLSSVIQLYLAWGKPFLVLLDDDSAGKKEKARYLEQFGPLMTDRVVTYRDLDESLAGVEIEDLLTKSEIVALQQTAYPDDTSVNKTHAMRAVQELIFKKQAIPVSDESKRRIALVIEKCRASLGVGE